MNEDRTTGETTTHMPSSGRVFTTSALPLEDLSPAARERWHRLEASYQTSARSGDPDRVLSDLEQARTTGDWPTPLRHRLLIYETALRSMAGRSTPVEYLTAWEQLVDDEGSLPRDRVHALFYLARFHGFRELGEPRLDDQAMAIGRQTNDDAAQAIAFELRARIEYERGSVALMAALVASGESQTLDLRRGPWTEPMRASVRAYDAADHRHRLRSADAEQRIHTLNNQAHGAMLSGDIEAAMDLSHRALGIAQRTGYVTQRNDLHVTLALCQILRSCWLDPPRAVWALCEARQLLEETAQWCERHSWLKDHYGARMLLRPLLLRLSVDGRDNDQKIGKLEGGLVAPEVMARLRQEVSLLLGELVLLGRIDLVEPQSVSEGFT